MARYCFVEFNDPIAASQALERLSGQLIPGTNGVRTSFTAHHLYLPVLLLLLLSYRKGLS